MLSIPGQVKIFLAVEPADMRQGFDRLAARVSQTLRPLVQATGIRDLSLPRRGQGAIERDDLRRRLGHAARWRRFVQRAPRQALSPGHAGNGRIRQIANRKQFLLLSE